MPLTNVPQPVFGPNGFSSPADSAILAGVIADFQLAFGGNLNFTTSGGSVINATPQGQLSSSLSAIISNTDQTFVFYTTQVDPAFATGRMQDAIGRIYFITRNPALPTVLNIECIGAFGVVIPQGALIQDSAGNTYVCNAQGTIPISGNVVLQFSNTQVGPIAVPDTNAVSIIQTIPGWDSVTCLGGTIGQDVESRTAFEERRAASVAGNSFGAIGSILGKVSAVPGVLDYFGYDNATATSVVLNGVSIAARTIYIAVSGGAASDVAFAIWSKKAPGCGYTGNTTVNVTDPNPLYSTPPVYAVSFEIPGSLQILVAVSLVNGPNVPANAATLVQNQIVLAFSGGITGIPRARINSLLLASNLINAIQQLGSWVQVRSLFIGSNNNNDASNFTGTIATNVLTVTEINGVNPIVVGQTISDQLGRIPEGTVIGSQLTGSPGSTGTYQLNTTPAPVPGASFTGTGAGTNLTVSGVTGVIGIGDVIQGTGVTGWVTIVSQTSGTPGGAGVYVTSSATTSSANALTSSPDIFGAAPNLNTLQVQANQEPSISVANIAVAVS